MSCGHVYTIVSTHAVTATGSIVHGYWPEHYDECVLCGEPRR